MSRRARAMERTGEKGEEDENERRFFLSSLFGSQVVQSGVEELDVDEERK